MTEPSTSELQEALIPEESKDSFALKKEKLSEESFLVSLLNKSFATIALIYICYSLFGMVAWVSHLGARVEFLQPFLPALGYAHNLPVKNVYELFYYNGIAALGFVLPHSLLRPPMMQKLFGFKHARLLYCLMGAATCHLLLYFFRPISSTDLLGFPYDEYKDAPLFTLPVPKLVHDVLSVSMLAYAFYATMSNPDTYIILGFNRVFYGLNSGKDAFPKGLSPRMDIITWMGYAVWLKAGSLGFILFSGLSILPYRVYTWDIILRVVAAVYLRLRSQGFRIWVGRIEHTHHLIWVLRGIIVVSAMAYQYHLLQKSNSSESFDFNTSLFNPYNILVMSVSGLAVALILDRLEKIR